MSGSDQVLQRIPKIKRSPPQDVDRFEANGLLNVVPRSVYWIEFSHFCVHKKPARRRLIVAVCHRQVMRWSRAQTLHTRVHQVRLFSLQGMENLPRVLCVLEFFGGNIWNSHSVLSELLLVLVHMKSGNSTLSFLYRKFFPIWFCNKCSFGIFRRAFLSPMSLAAHRLKKPTGGTGGRPKRVTLAGMVWGVPPRR